MLQNYLYLKPTSCYNMTDTNQRDTEKIMQLRYEILDTFWSLFRSVNREIYMESLLVINEEYQYSNYFLTKEISGRRTRRILTCWRRQHPAFYGGF